MVEINFIEVYCQPAKNIFEATILHCIKYFKRVKEKEHERDSFAHTSFRQWRSREEETSWGKRLWTRLGGGSTQGRRQKIFQGGGQWKKYQKLAKKYRKIALFSLF